MSKKVDLQPLAVQPTSAATSHGSQVETSMTRYFHRVLLQNLGATQDSITIWERIGTTDVVLMRLTLGPSQAIEMKNDDLEKSTPVLRVRSEGYLRSQSGANTWNLSGLYTDEF